MSNKLVFLLIGVLMLLMLGLGGGLFMMWNKLSALNTQAVANAGNNPDLEKAIEHPLGPIFSLQTFIVNLADKGGNRYLRVTMDLELGNPELEAEINKRLPQVRDSILMILPSKQFEDIASMEGKIALRDEIIAKLNSLFARTVVTNTFFTEFVVQ